MTSPEILHSCGALLSQYRAVICDIWGVLHDGVTAYEDSNITLAKYRENGGRVVLLSNSPQISWQIGALLERKGVWRSVYDGIVTSGDVTLRVLNGLGLKTLYHIGPGRHEPLYEGRPWARSSLEKAEGIVCTGFFDDDYEDMSPYAPLLDEALARKLPFICANPDLIVDVGGVLYPCAGVLAQQYEERGGKVYWAGKPHKLAFEMARDEIFRLGGALEKKDILVIGDTLRTDIAGAEQMGFDALFVAQGIHKKDVAPHGDIDQAALEKLFFKAHARAAVFNLK